MLFHFKLLIYTILQLSTLGDKQFENPQTGNLSKIMKDSVLVKECLLDLNKPRTEQTEGSTERKKKGFVCDHFLLYDVIFSNFKNDMVFGCPLSEMSEVLFTKDLKSGECNLLISTVPPTCTSTAPAISTN